MTVLAESKLQDINDVIEFCKVNDIPADIVGQWIWVKFESKPPVDTRDLLKGAGFRWVRKRGQWAHNCGVRTRAGKENPRHKYGERSIHDGGTDEDSICSDDYVSDFERNCGDSMFDRS